MLENKREQVSIDSISPEIIEKAKNNLVGIFKNNEVKQTSELFKSMAAEEVLKLVDILIECGNLVLFNEYDEINDYPYRFRFNKYDENGNQIECYACYLLTSPDGTQYVEQCEDERKKENRITGNENENPLGRWENGGGYSQNQELREALERYGWENFRKEILLTGCDYEGSLTLERFFIKNLW